MLASRKSLFAALLFSASSPWLARSQGPSTDTPLLEQHPRTDHHSGFSPGITQSALPPSDLRSDAEMVLVPAFVSNSLGAPVNQLAQGDFRIFEDGVEQPVTYF